LFRFTLTFKDLVIVTLMLEIEHNYSKIATNILTSGCINAIYACNEKRDVTFMNLKKAGVGRGRAGQ